MKHLKSTASHVTPKGVRMHWEPLSEVKPVKLSSNVITGKFLSEKELNNRNNNSHSKNTLVP